MKNNPSKIQYLTRFMDSVPRMTPDGLVFCLIVGITGGLAFYTGNNIIFIIFSFLSALLLFSFWCSLFNIRHLKLKRNLSGDLFAGNSYEYTVRISNKSRRVLALSVRLVPPLPFTARLSLLLALVLPPALASAAPRLPPPSLILA